MTALHDVTRSSKITPILQQAFDYWNVKRAGRKMPARRDIDPSEIKSLLPHIALVDVVETAQEMQPYDFRLRLIGTVVESFIGSRRTGLLLSEFNPRTPDSKAWGKLEAVVHSGEPSFDHVPYVGQKSEFMTMADVVLPLSDTGSSVTMLLLAHDFIPRSTASLSGPPHPLSAL